VKVGATDGGSPDLDQHVAWSNIGDVNPLHLQPRGCLSFDHGSHFVCHFDCSPLSLWGGVQNLAKYDIESKGLNELAF
jgi:hypothetical protein